MKFYNIQTVSRLCGVSAHCIRAWEKRYGAIKPERMDNGRRVYSEKELNRLMMLGKLSSMGNSIGLIARLSDDELNKLIDKMGEQKKALPVITNSLVDPKSYLNNMLMALHSYKLDVLTHELNKASMDLSCRDFAMEVVAALFRRVGELVQAGKMSYAQEHTLSAITKFFIGRRIGQHYKVNPRNKSKIILATPQGESHTIGLLLSALLMAEYGVDFIYLGEDLPAQAIADAAKATNASTILLSITGFYSYSGLSINNFVNELQQTLPNTQVWLGGAVEQYSGYSSKSSEVVTFKKLDELDQKLKKLSEVAF